VRRSQHVRALVSSQVSHHDSTRFIYLRSQLFPSAATFYYSLGFRGVRLSCYEQVQCLLGYTVHTEGTRQAKRVRYKLETFVRSSLSRCAAGRILRGQALRTRSVPDPNTALIVRSWMVNYSYASGLLSRSTTPDIPLDRFPRADAIITFVQ